MLMQGVDGLCFVIYKKYGSCISCCSCIHDPVVFYVCASLFLVSCSHLHVDDASHSHSFFLLCFKLLLLLSGPGKC